jgi:uncharacterized membrane protein YidH (DUF202 family)
MPPEPSPPGLQNERTALSWQRTALAVLAGSAVITRLTLNRLGPFALLSVVVAAPVCVWILIESRRRYEHDAGPQARARSRGGRAHAALTIAIMAIAATQLAAILVAP